jgi:hypothetical protein
MQRALYLTAALILFIAVETFAQDDSTRYINGLPVSEDDTARQFLKNQDLTPKNRLSPVPVSQLPEKLLDALDTEEQYKGWRDTTVYFDSNTEIYTVPVKYAEGVKIFGMSKNGDPVTFREVSDPRKE